VVAWAQGYAHRTQSVSLGTSRPPQMPFELSKTGVLHVTVRDAGTGTPLDAHLVVETATGAMLPVRAQRSGDGGAFTFSLAPGQYRPGNVEIGME
jgi:hypothetical protein